MSLEINYLLLPQRRREQKVGRVKELRSVEDEQSNLYRQRGQVSQDA